MMEETINIEQYLMSKNYLHRVVEELVKSMPISQREKVTKKVKKTYPKVFEELKRTLTKQKLSSIEELLVFDSIIRTVVLNHFEGSEGIMPMDHYDVAYQ